MNFATPQFIQSPYSTTGALRTEVESVLGDDYQFDANAETYGALHRELDEVIYYATRDNWIDGVIKYVKPPSKDYRISDSAKKELKVALGYTSKCLSALKVAPEEAQAVASLLSAIQYFVADCKTCLCDAGSTKPPGGLHVFGLPPWGMATESWAANLVAGTLCAQ